MPPEATRPPWWRGRWFVRLLAVRVTGQVGDGVFQAALASYALFSDDQATAAGLATAAAVVLLPWSLVGPYAGVLLDRWSRRQVLLLGNLIRTAVLVALAGAVLADLPAPVVYGGALLALGTNRFLLAGLSAALPHTVPQTRLTEANAVTPTVGTGAFVTGLGLAAVLRAGALGPVATEHALLLVSGFGYLAAAALALTMPRGLLGPDDAGVRSRPQAAHPVAGLVEGLRHLAARPWPAAALASLAGMRLWFGLLTVSAVLTLRNATTDDGAAIGALGGFTVATGAGFLVAAAVAPVAARRWGRGLTMVTALLVAAAAPVAPMASVAVWSWWVMGAVLGLGAQVTKICVDAVVQAGVDDDVRGRVFSLYDMAFNVAFVLAAGLAVVLLPASGRSVPVLVMSALGLVLVAAVLAATLQRRPAPARVTGTATPGS